MKVDKNMHFIWVIMYLLVVTLNGQSHPFEISLDPMEIEGLGGIQSFAHGQHDGKWLIIGGRLDGLHLRQPFAAFDIAGHNTQLIVVDPIAGQKWSASLSSLPTDIKEQLSATNMEFFQQGSTLYVVGGYGYSAKNGDHITYNKMTAVDVPNTISAILNNEEMSSYFRQITDENMAVTGGHLKKINDTYYLVGGHKFNGRYNPMGADHGPGFTQEYTNAIRKFKIIDDGNNLSVVHLQSLVDSEHLHRRDLNVVEQILPDGSQGLTAFSGVFMHNVDLPFLNCVEIDSLAYNVNNEFKQYYNHYHCATLPIYDESKNEMHNVFFGGIAQYYEYQGELIKDDNVPFVKTIARVTRDSNGKLTEFKLPIEMPGYLGSGAEFLLNEDLPVLSNGVLDFDKLSEGKVLIGYIFGGINSSMDNIFFTNNGSQSSANSRIFKVFIEKTNFTATNDIKFDLNSGIRMQILPNPNDGNFIVKYFLDHEGEVRISLFELNGKKVEEKFILDTQTGENIYRPEWNQFVKGQTYILRLQSSGYTVTEKILYNF